MEIVGEYLGLGMDKKIWRYCKTHWQDWFPKLGSATSFAKQSASLFGIKRQVFESLSAELTQGNDVYLFDGFPIPVCHIKRYKRSSNHLNAEAAVGYCAAKNDWSAY